MSGGRVSARDHGLRGGDEAGRPRRALSAGEAAARVRRRRAGAGRWNAAAAARGLALAGVVVAGWTMGGCAAPEPRTRDVDRDADSRADRAADEAALRALWAEFERAFDAADAAAIAALYAPDADRIDAAGERVVGRAAIASGYAALLERRAAAGPTAPFRAEIDVRFVHRDVALLDGRWSGRRDGQAVEGLFTITAARRDGRWLMVAGRDRGLVDR